MIYASTSIILNLSHTNTWELLQTAIKDIDQYSKEIDCTNILETYYDGYLREVVLNSTAETLKERVFIIKDQSKIVLRLNEHPLYQGETLFQIVAPDDEFLSEKKVTLTAILSWRIHPGLVEAPILYKDEFLSDLLKNIQNQANENTFII